jgi:anti-anti-sigma factor
MSIDHDPQLRVSASRSRNGRTVVIAAGEIDLATCDQLREVLAACDGDVTVDLSPVGYLDSSGIGVLIAQRNRLGRSGGSLVLHRPQPQVRKTLGIVGLDAFIAA